MKILQLCFRVPFPPHDGGAIAMYNITKGLNEAGHEVTVLAFNTPKHFQNNDVLNGIAKLETVFVNTNISPLKAFLNLFNSLPYNVERFVSPNYEKAIIRLIKEVKYDVIHFEGMYVAWYIDVVKQYFNGPCVLRTHNLEYMIWKRLAENEGNAIKKWYLGNLSKKLKAFEVESLGKFDSIASISGEDAKMMKEWSISTPVKIIPPGAYFETWNKPHSKKAKTVFILSALEWMPNLEGLNWFLKNVWDRLKSRVPDLELHIAGKNTPESIQKLNMNGVFVHGFVPDATEFLKNHDLMLVPLLSGSGVRIKIIEGMSAEKCILTTSVGAEGIDYTNNQDILIRDTPDEWVKTIEDYFKHPERYKDIGSNAVQLIREKYENGKVIEELVTIYKKLLN